MCEQGNKNNQVKITKHPMFQMIGPTSTHSTKQEMALWTAVLDLAVKDARALIRKVRKDPSLWIDPIFRSEVIHLKRYFRSRSMDPGGFGFICDLMDVDPEHAARSIEEKYLRHLIPITAFPASQVGCPTG
ncbi:MAG: hypothetical protein HQL95_15680 [Magnetococcales bacterium]|nr:hypothetical protein [Magnetococcales bacterium]